MSEYNIVRYLALQYKEIEEHKYYLSEKAGYDVGKYVAIDDWVKSGHATRFHDTYMAHIEQIEKACIDVCNKECGGLEHCILSTDRIHKLLED